nr:hypothetical protein BaRGS_008758 [Batillaria attramentaria]
MTISPVTSEKNFHLYTRIELRSDIQAQDNPYYTQDRPDDSEPQANGDYLEPSAICRDSQFNPYDTLQEDYETLDKAELGHSSSYAELNEFSSSPDPNEYKNTGM